MGLDMATRTGWAVMDGQRLVHSDMKAYTKGKTALCLEERLLQFRSDLSTLFMHYQPDLVAYEVAHMRGGGPTRSGVGMETVLRMECYLCGIPVFGVHSLTLKKFATGSGKAEKPEMIEAVNVFLAGARVVTDDNEADAIHVARWGVVNVVKGSDGKFQLVEQLKPTGKPKRSKTA